MRRLLLAAAAILLLAASSAQAATHLNAYSIEGQFMCVSCHEPLNQVNSPEAQNEKVTLRLLVRQGLDLGQVKAKMVDYYGPDVLGRPPAKGFNLLIYIVPPAVIVIALALVLFTLPRWRRRAQAQPVGPADPAPELDPTDAARLEEELSHFDG